MSTDTTFPQQNFVATCDDIAHHKCHCEVLADFPSSPRFLQEPNGLYLTQDPVSKSQIIQFAISLMEAKPPKGIQIHGTKDAKDFARLKLSEHEREIFAVLFFDNHHRIIAYEELFFGTIHSCQVYPREVLKRVIFHNAASVILAHNHPSGKAEPSQADIHITTKLKDILSIIDVRILDHIVVGEDVCSMSELGLI